MPFGIKPEKTLLYVVIGAAIITAGFVFFLFSNQVVRSIKITAPTGGEEWEIGKTHEITWKASGIQKVGIVLFKGKEPQWIARDISASAGKYNWQIYPGQSYGADYWLAVFEYPWKTGNIISYSPGTLAIIYPELATCDSLSIQKEWLFLPSDFPNLRRVFITANEYKGKLGGLDGADKKCQQEADEKKLGSKWHAFLGGDSDEELAVQRMYTTPRQAGGVFVDAAASATLITRNATCHRLLGKDINEFIRKLSDTVVMNQGKYDQTFLNNLKNIWIGKIDERSPKRCITIFSPYPDLYSVLAETYSSTSTCQNWTVDSRFVEGYPVPFGGIKPKFSTCYTKQGVLTDAVAVAGLAVGLTKDDVAFSPYQGKSCDTPQKLICMEE